MSTAGVALTISIFGAVLAAASLGWQVWAFLLSGPRVTCSLECGYVTPATDTPESTVNRLSVSVPPSVWVDRPLFRENPGQCLFVSARNVGRAAVWVDNVGLLCWPTAWAGHGSGDGVDQPRMPYRLDAGETRTWTVPLTAGAREPRTGLCPI
jgi:hypothetical protein